MSASDGFFSPFKPLPKLRERADAWIQENRFSNLAYALRRLKPWRVKGFEGDSDATDAWPDTEAPVELPDAHIVSSRLRNSPDRHMVVLDIDYDAFVLPSSQRGHHHLILDVPNGVEHEKYLHLLEVLADCGIIETGYAKASAQRGWSAIRVPWLKKGDPLE